MSSLMTKEAEESAEEGENLEGRCEDDVGNHGCVIEVLEGTWWTTLPRVDSVDEEDARVRSFRLRIQVLGGGPVGEGRYVIVRGERVGDGGKLHGGGGQGFGG